MNDWVLVDTLVWASFFTKPRSAEKLAVDDLIDSDRVASRLRLSHYIETTWDDWKLAAEIGRDLAQRGHAVPITDLVVFAVAKRLDMLVCSTDPHFDLMPDLKRHTFS